MKTIKEGKSMSDENHTKKGRTIAISGVIGFVLVALLVGMALGGYLAIAVIEPTIQKMQGGNNNQGTSSQNTSNQNGNNNNNYSTNNPNVYNNPGSSNDPNNNYNNNQPNNNPNNNQNSPTENNTNNTQNGNPPGITNNNPARTNPTGQYAATNCQFNVNLQQNGNQATGQITANVNCSVEENGNNIQLSLTVQPDKYPIKSEPRNGHNTSNLRLFRIPLRQPNYRKRIRLNRTK